MITERASGVTTVCRLSKYLAAAMTYAVWAATAGTETADVRPLLASAGFLGVTWMAFGPTYPAWNRTCDKHLWYTAIRCAVHETGIASICLLIMQPLVSAPHRGHSTLIGCVIVIFFTLIALNRWLPDVIARLMFRTSPHLRILILGSPEAAAALQKQLSAAARLGIEFVTDGQRPATSTLKLFDPAPCKRTDVTGTPADLLLASLKSGPIHQVAFLCEDFDDTTIATQREIEQLCDEYGLRLSVYFNGILPEHRPPARELRETGFEEARHEPLLNPVHQAAKRTLDVLIAIPVVAVVLPPLCIAIRVAQWFQSPGPLLYRQERYGKNGSSFQILKFRTMHVPEPGMAAMKDDPTLRIYAAGALLRDSRLDEIPQFINVLLGSMSIVGPRAHHAQDCANFRRIVRHYPMRFVVKPGITGLAQYREFLRLFDRDCIESRVQSDMEYINNWSLWTDVSLIIRTGRVIPESILRSILRIPTLDVPSPASGAVLQPRSENQSGKLAA